MQNTFDLPLQFRPSRRLWQRGVITIVYFAILIAAAVVFSWWSDSFPRSYWVGTLLGMFLAAKLAEGVFMLLTYYKVQITLAETSIALRDILRQKSIDPNLVTRITWSGRFSIVLHQKALQTGIRIVDFETADQEQIFAYLLRHTSESAQSSGSRAFERYRLWKAQKAPGQLRVNAKLVVGLVFGSLIALSAYGIYLEATGHTTAPMTLFILWWAIGPYAIYRLHDEAYEKWQIKNRPQHAVAEETTEHVSA